MIEMTFSLPFRHAALTAAVFSSLIAIGACGGGEADSTSRSLPQGASSSDGETSSAGSMGRNLEGGNAPGIDQNFDAASYSGFVEYETITGLDNDVFNKGSAGLSCDIVPDGDVYKYPELPDAFREAVEGVVMNPPACREDLDSLRSDKFSRSDAVWAAYQYGPFVNGMVRSELLPASYGKLYASALKTLQKGEVLPVVPGWRYYDELASVSHAMSIPGNVVKENHSFSKRCTKALEGAEGFYKCISGSYSGVVMLPEGGSSGGVCSLVVSDSGEVKFSADGKDFQPFVMRYLAAGVDYNKDG